MRGDTHLRDIVRAGGFDQHPDSVYILDDANRIVYCNPAWDDFARANHGEKATVASAIGRDVLEVCAPELRGFYQQLFAVCRQRQSSVFHGYHCSSPTRLRVFRMNLDYFHPYLVIVNTLMQDTEHPGPPLKFHPSYMREEIATMCANCRRVRNWERDSWDWVPSLIEGAERHRFSHGLCPPCRDFYYSEDLATFARDLQSE